MLCIFKTPTEIVLDSLGNPISRPGPGGGAIFKVRAKRPAGECQQMLETTIAPCEHSPTVRHTQAGCLKGTLWRVVVLRRRADRSYVTGDNEVAARALAPAIFDGIYVEETEVHSTNEQPAPTYNEVLISPGIIKKDGTQATLADFPDGWSFGNGVTVGNTIRLKDGSEYVLSWVVFAPAQAVAVRARYAQLRALMED